MTNSAPPDHDGKWSEGPWFPILVSLLILALIVALVARPRRSAEDTRAQVDLEAQRGVTHTDADRFCAALDKIRDESAHAIAAVHGRNQDRVDAAVAAIKKKVAAAESAAATLPQVGRLDALVASRTGVVQAARNSGPSVAEKQQFVARLVDVSLKAERAAAQAQCPT